MGDCSNRREWLDINAGGAWGSTRWCKNRGFGMRVAVAQVLTSPTLSSAKHELQWDRSFICLFYHVMSSAWSTTTALWVNTVVLVLKIILLLALIFCICKGLGNDHTVCIHGENGFLTLKKLYRLSLTFFLAVCFLHNKNTYA